MQLSFLEVSALMFLTAQSYEPTQSKKCSAVFTQEILDSLFDKKLIEDDRKTPTTLGLKFAVRSTMVFEHRIEDYISSYHSNH